MTEDRQAIAEVFSSFFSRKVPFGRVRAAEPVGFDAGLWAELAPLIDPAATLGDLAVVAFEAGRRLAPVPLVEALVAARLLGRDLDPSSVATVALAGPGLVPAGAVASVAVWFDGSALLLSNCASLSASDPEKGAQLVANLGAAPLARLDLHDGEAIESGEEARRRWAVALDEWRVLTAAALAGLAAGALDLGVDYAKHRRQFGVPIGTFQALQHRLADAATLADAARLLAAAAANEPEPGAVAAAAFVAATWAAREAAGTSLHVHGGYGFMLEYDIQLYFRRATAWPLARGDPAAELQHVPLGPPADPPSGGFRAEVRAFLDGHLTPEAVARAHATGTMHDWALHRALADRGWLDSQALDPFDRAVLDEELARAGAPVDGWGTAELVANTLRVAGTTDQQAEVVPRVFAGELLICLGYSEPDAGSDVASVTTRAVRDGDGWIVTGQKMFTTLAHEAGYVLLLTRTNAGVPKHLGLTLFLVPMDSPGIEVRAIHTLGGERTNVTFYNDVRVDDRWRVGEVDGGWDVMKVALAFERQPTTLGELMRLVEQAAAWAESAGLLDEPEVRGRLARAAVEVELGRVLSARLAEQMARGAPGVVEGSMAKLFCSEAFQRAAADLLDLLGPEAVVQPSVFEHAHRHSVVTTIYGGSSEIQRSIIAERGLGLPSTR